jgi:hypothetical protein
MFPIEAVVLTVFLRFLMPVVRRAKLIYGTDEDMRFGKKAIVTLVCLTLVGVISATGYMYYRYETSSRSADFSSAERVAANHEMADQVVANTTQWADETVVCVVDSAYRGLFDQETTYNVSVYILNEEAFAAGVADNDSYSMDTLWAYSKSGPSKDKYGSLVKVATAEVVKNEKTGEILSFSCSPVE